MGVENMIEQTKAATQFDDTDGQLKTANSINIIQETEIPLQRMEVDQKDQEQSGEYLWKITSFTRPTSPKLYSEEFQVGGYYWRLLLFPRGNTLNTQNNQNLIMTKDNIASSISVSLYLDQPDSECLPIHSIPKAGFKFTLLSQEDKQKNIAKDTEHYFSSKENDWGFTAFHPLVEIINQNNGFIVNDTIFIKIDIKILNLDSVILNSRSNTQFVGLKNQGATCYMNSLLQSLFNIGQFREAVYKIPTNAEDYPANSIPLALQSLFYKLEHSPTSVSTKDLTKSFGWSNAEATLYQQDVQELNRLLMEKLEEKMKGTSVENVIQDLFQGYFINYIECINVQYKREVKESFMDIHLDIQGCKTVYQSLEKFTEPEVLDGDNKLSVPEHGLQEVRKGIQFEQLPPVVFLHLKRFAFDFDRNREIKLNDRFEFYDEVDFDIDDRKFFAHTAKDRPEKNLYMLHSVFVHSGIMYAGHYYSYIRTQKGDHWLKFDDEKVTHESKERAIQEQYGIDLEAIQENETHRTTNNSMQNMDASNMNLNNSVRPNKNNSNAYMLVYVRKDDWDKIMQSSGAKCIPDHLKNLLKIEIEQKEQKRREKEEAHQVINFRLASNELIRKQVGESIFLDLVSHTGAPMLKMSRSQTIRDLKLEIQKSTNIPCDKQTIMVFIRQKNNVYQPRYWLDHDQEISDDTTLRTVHKRICNLCKSLKQVWQHHYHLASRPISVSNQYGSSVQHQLMVQQLAKQNNYAMLLNGAVGGVGGGLSSLPVRNMNQGSQTMSMNSNNQNNTQNNSSIASTYNQLMESSKNSFLMTQVTYDLYVDFRQGTDQSFLLYIKYFDIHTQKLSFVDRAYTNDHMARDLEDLLQIFLKTHNMEGEVSDYYVLLEEYNCDEDTFLQELRLSIQPDDLEPGSIILFQKKLNGTIIHKRSDGHIFTTTKAETFIRNYLNQVSVQFKNFNSEQDQAVTIELSREDLFEDMTQKLAKAIKVDNFQLIRILPFDLQTQRKTPALNKISVVYHKIKSLTVQEFLTLQQTNEDLLYYEVLDVPFPILDQFMYLKVYLYLEDTSCGGEYTLRAMKNDLVQNLLNKLKQQIPQEMRDNNLVLLHQVGQRIEQMMDMDKVVERLPLVNTANSSSILRAEPEPLKPYQTNMGHNVIGFVHFVELHHLGSLNSSMPNSSQVTPYKTPFILNVYENETMKEVKKRVQDKLKVSDVEFSKWKFFILVNAQIFHPIVSRGQQIIEDNRYEQLQIKDHERLHELLLLVEGMNKREVGILHEDKTNTIKKQSYSKNNETSMRIH